MQILARSLALLVLCVGLVACGSDAGGDGVGTADAGESDGSGETDAGSEDTGSDDTGSEDAGSEDTDSDDTGSEDTGSADTGSDDTGDPDVVDPEDTNVSDAPFIGSDDGEPCSTNGVCGGGTCLPDPDYPAGYCSSTCDDSDDCYSPDAACVDNDGENICARECTFDADCRLGYVCLDQGGTDVCLPPVPLTGAVDGDACADDSDCRGGTCLQDPEYPDGYCTTLGCQNFMDCASDGEDNRCLIQQQACVRICDEGSDCRDGYICQAIGGGLGYCSPNPERPIDEPMGYPWDITCELASDGGIVEFDYEVAEGTTSYVVVPFALDGRRVSPVRIELPSGERIDLRGENDFQLVPSQLWGFLNPTIVPATAQYADQLESGTHRYRLETTSDNLCWYLIEEATAGTTIDMRVYLVDVPGVDAATAATDENFAPMIETAEMIFSAAGVELGEVEYIDATEDQVDRYGIIRSQGDVEQLVASTELPGPDVDDVLVVNVFFTRGFAFSDGSGAIGISMGLPGPAGLHGTRTSGLAFTSEFIGTQFMDRDGNNADGNVYTGVILAHEIGHYLGLFHTTEQGGQGYDPLPDTAQCSGRDFPTGCADLTNLMFPFAGVDHTVVTEDQSWVIQVNPLSKD